MAGDLLKIAAERKLKTGPVCTTTRGPLRGILRALPLSRDRRPGTRHRRGARRPRLRAGHGPADLRRRRLRQDRGRPARRLRRGHGGLSGRRRGADHAARAPAPRDLRRALSRPAGGDRPALPLRRSQGRQGGQGAPGIGQARHRRRHPRAARQGRLVQEPRPAHHRRGAALRRRPQGAHQAVARRRPCPDPDRDADPAHAPDVAGRREGPQPDRHGPGRPPGGANLRVALRLGHRARGDASRAAARRPELLRLSAHQRPGARPQAAGGAGAGSPLHGRPRPDGRAPTWSASWAPSTRARSTC